MIVLDTHAWRVVAEPSRLGAGATAAIDAADAIGVCTISCWEIAMLAAKARIRLDRPIATWLDDALARPRFTLLPITPAIAAGAAQSGMHGDPADRLIVATAVVHGASLVTKDEAIRAAGVVQTVW